MMQHSDVALLCAILSIIGRSYLWHCVYLFLIESG